MTGCRAETRTRQEDLAAAPAPGRQWGLGGKPMASSPAPLGATAAVLRFPGAAAGTLRPPKSSSAPMVLPGEHRVLPFTAQAVTSSSTSASGNGLGICGSHQQPPPSQGAAGTVIKLLLLRTQSGCRATLQQGFRSAQIYCTC